MTDNRNLGPDETDRDLIDGSWEDDYYAGRHESRDWTNVILAVAILIVLSLVVPLVLVATS